MVEVTDQLLSGSLGYFWPVYAGRLPDLDDAEALRGFLREKDGELELVLLRDDPSPSKDTDAPIGFIGATEHSGVVVRDLLTAGGTLRAGGSRASVNHYTAQTVIAELAINSVTSLDMVSVSALFHGDRSLQWTGLKAVDQKITTNKQGRVQRIQLDMRSVPDLVTSLPRSVELKLSAYWRSSPDPDRGYVIDTGLKASVETSRPPLTITALLRVQDLLGIAFGGYYPVIEGHARPVGSSDPGPLWNSQLMAMPDHTIEADRRSFPAFMIEHIGGIDGVARWLRLCESHPRAVSPIINRLRQGTTSPEVQTLELAAAIEYWVAHNRRHGRVWAKKINRRDTPVAALARYVGSSFAGWIHDPAKWSALFWDNYNDLKHRPRFSYSRRDLWLVSEGAHQLLTASLLNRVAPTREPARRIFSDHRNSRLGRELRNLVR